MSGSPQHHLAVLQRPLQKGTAVTEAAAGRGLRATGVAIRNLDVKRVGFVPAESLFLGQVSVRGFSGDWARDGTSSELPVLPAGRLVWMTPVWAEGGGRCQRPWLK